MFVTLAASASCSDLSCVALPHAATVWPTPSDTDARSKSQNSDVLDAATTDVTSDANEFDLDDDELLALAATQLDGS
jgi:transcriptional regulator of met regulon